MADLPVKAGIPPDLYVHHLPSTLTEAYMEAQQGPQLESIDGEIGLLRVSLVTLVQDDSAPRGELRKQVKAICDAIKQREDILRNRKLYVHIKDVMRMLNMLEGIARDFIPDDRARARFFERCRSISLESAR